ncbi:unnamed protein product [Sphagnum jensenii]|uniref:Uncharacterized protein n=2 Tax=Sphagnum jensenii TaxID=128206 RepID=A0ABP0VKL7_9BRYO
MSNSNVSSISASKLGTLNGHVNSQLTGQLNGANSNRSVYSQIGYPRYASVETNGYTGNPALYPYNGIEDKIFDSTALAPNGAVDPNVLLKDVNLAKIKPGKVTSGLYNGIPHPLLQNNSMNGRYMDTSAYLYESMPGGDDGKSKYHSGYVNGSGSGKHTERDVSAFDRTNSLNMLCSIDMVKYGQNNTNGEVSSSSHLHTTSFPWTTDSMANLNNLDDSLMLTNGSNRTSTIDNHTQTHLDSSNGNINLQSSTSTISLSDFSMNLWPSMSNLVTAAAEALSSNERAKNRA